MRLEYHVAEAVVLVRAGAVTPVADGPRKPVERVVSVRQVKPFQAVHAAARPRRAVAVLREDVAAPARIYAGTTATGIWLLAYENMIKTTKKATMHPLCVFAW